jgi:hypothetical protein
MHLSREQIAEAVGATPHHVCQTLYTSKRATGKKKSGKGEAAKPNGDETTQAEIRI